MICWLITRCILQRRNKVLAIISYKNQLIKCSLPKYFHTQIKEIKHDIACKLFCSEYVSHPSLLFSLFFPQPSTRSSCDDFSSLEWSLTFSSPSSVWPTSIKEKQKKLHVENSQKTCILLKPHFVSLYILNVSAIKLLTVTSKYIEMSSF